MYFFYVMSFRFFNLLYSLDYKFVMKMWLVKEKTSVMEKGIQNKVQLEQIF